MSDTRRHLAKMITRLKPGDRITFTYSEFIDVPQYDYGSPFASVLELVVGSAFSIMYWEDPIYRTVTFERLHTPAVHRLRPRVSR
jgi:hypothetical protein